MKRKIIMKSDHELREAHCLGLARDMGTALIASTRFINVICKYAKKAITLLKKSEVIMGTTIRFLTAINNFFAIGAGVCTLPA